MRYAKKWEYPMSLDVSSTTEARLIAKAKEQGLSVEAFLQQLIEDAGNPVSRSKGEAPELPVWHLGVTGSLHRRDIYDDVG
jgi:hypothetical protein